MEFSELLDTYLLPTAIIVAQIFAIIVPLLVAVAYLTYFERKVIASMQLRKGPNVVGPFGLLQPLADGAKLFIKETILPSGANKILFAMAPMLTFILSFILMYCCSSSITYSTCSRCGAISWIRIVSTSVSSIACSNSCSRR